MKNNLLIIFVISILLCLILIYEYPFQKKMAMIKFYKYIEIMESYKDYKMGGYEIRVIYKDEEPRIIYYYHYDIIKRDNNGKILINNMNLEISCRGYNYSINKEWNIKNGLKVKYPPLKDYR